MDEETHLSPTEEISLTAVKERAVKGIAVLTGRTFILSMVSFAATALLTVYLDPSQFGIFFIVSAIVNFFAYFSDVGLAAALIQKKETVTKEDLNTTFFMQQILVLSVLLILLIINPYLQKYYDLNADGKLLLYSLAFSLLLSSLKTIPSVLLERKLEFSKLVIPQVIENLVYNVAVVYFAWRGFGIRSFAYAVVLRGLSGFLIMYAIKPWIPSLHVSKESLKKLLKFGVPYQVNTLLATVKDDGMTAFLGGVIGSSGLGYLAWAQKWSQYPLRLFMDHVLKVTFPAFSRMQDHKKALAQSVGRSVFFICILVFPCVIGFTALAPRLIEIIPRYEKWRPALVPLLFVGINTLFASVTTPLTNLLNAVGKIKVTFKLMIMWTVLTWALIPYLAIRYGVNGAALGYGLVGASSGVAIYIVYKEIKFSLFTTTFIPLVSSLFMAISIYIVGIFVDRSISSVVLLTLVGGSVYGGFMYLFVGQSIVNDAKRGIGAIFKK